MRTASLVEEGEMSRRTKFMIWSILGVRAVGVILFDKVLQQVQAHHDAKCLGRRTKL